MRSGTDRGGRGDEAPSAVRALSEQSGAALALAIYALAVLGALVAGVFFLALAEHRVGRNTLALAHAVAAAEEGAVHALAAWDAGAMATLTPGDSAPFAGVTAAATGRFEGTVTRLGASSFVIRSAGSAVDRTARRVVGLLVRTDSAGAPRPLGGRAWVWFY